MEREGRGVGIGVLKGHSRRTLRTVFILFVSFMFLAFSLILTISCVSLLQGERDFFGILPIVGCLAGLICCFILSLFVVHIKRQRDLVENTLRENKERYRSIIAASNTGAWEYHADTHYQWCSPEYFKMLGYEADQFLKNSTLSKQDIWDDLLHPDDRDRANEHFMDYLSNGSPGMYEGHFRMKHSNGDWKWIWSRAQTLRNPDGTRSNITLGTHIDVTERRNMEIELVKLNEKLFKYAHLNAHEVRGPVARLLGLVNISRLAIDIDYSSFFEKVGCEVNDIDKILKMITTELNDIEQHKFTIIRTSQRDSDQS